MRVIGYGRHQDPEELLPEIALLQKETSLYWVFESTLDRDRIAWSAFSYGVALRYVVSIDDQLFLYRVDAHAGGV